MKISSILPLIVFSLGFIMGLLNPNSLSFIRSEDLFNYTLAVLLFTVGLLIAGEWRDLVDGFRNKYVIILASSTITGGVISGIIGSVLLGFNLRLSLAIGLGSGWYSFAGSYITVYDPVGGLIAFIGNLLREALTLILYPIIARLDPLLGVPLGGATTMDTSLGVIARFAGSRVAGIAFLHGLIITILIPLIIPVIYP